MIDRTKKIYIFPLPSLKINTNRDLPSKLSSRVERHCSKTTDTNSTSSISVSRSTQREREREDSNEWQKKWRRKWFLVHVESGNGRSGRGVGGGEETHRRAPVITQDGRQTSADFNNDRCNGVESGLSGWWSIVRKSRREKREIEREREFWTPLFPPCYSSLMPRCCCIRPPPVSQGSAGEKLYANHLQVYINRQL